MKRSLEEIASSTKTTSVLKGCSTKAVVPIKHFNNVDFHHSRISLLFRQLKLIRIMFSELSVWVAPGGF
jgi:hypothetical protein